MCSPSWLRMYRYFPSDAMALSKLASTGADDEVVEDFDRRTGNVKATDWSGTPRFDQSGYTVLPSRTEWILRCREHMIAGT